MDIIYEDDDLLVINKPAGLLVHPGDYESRGEEVTLVDQLIEFDPQIKKAILDPESPVSQARPGIVHRLDKDTSGLMVIAKNQQTLVQLQQSFKDKTVKKIYAALQYGQFDKIRVENRLIRSKRKDRAMMISRSQEGRMAISNFIPQQTFLYQGKNITLSDVLIETGRTHQIRLQAANLNHPILGDKMYGSKLSQRLSQKLKITRQMLHAYQLNFPHPKSKKLLKFQIDLAKDFQTVLDQITKDDKN